MTTGAAQHIKSEYDRALRLAQMGKTREAAAILDALALKMPTTPELPYKRAQLAATLGDVETWCRAIDRAYSLRPKEPAILTEAVAAHRAANHVPRVLELMDAKIALEPSAIAPQADKALYLQQVGQFDASEKLFRKLLKKHPNETELYRMFAATIRFKPNDPLIGAMRRSAKHPRLNAHGLMHIHFALAKAMEDTKSFDRVFPHLRRANAAQRDLWPDDASARDIEWNAVVDAQAGLEKPSLAKTPSQGMIFVTGLPRSGTTLVEQIIASHSEVTAGGEIATALRQAYTQFGTGADMTPIAPLGETALKAFAEHLIQANQRKTAVKTPWLTDKSIMAFLIYGLLHASLPNARFIVVHRDPRDMAVSIYKNHFASGTHRYATDLAAIAEVIKLFRKIIAHWRETLPDRFTEVRYDDLVADPVPQSKALIASAGLEWQDHCLDFHKSGGPVKTLSLHQVRQPIYTSSAAAWKRYEADLQPFFDAWGDTPWD